jgi:ParB family chromosome partitioning protein
MSSHLQVPLKNLKFGQEDGAGINARVAGRLEGIEALAANLNANGQIEDLIIKKLDDRFYSVSNGNRRLAAFHMIYGADSEQPIGCTLHDVDEKKAFEFSLTTAVTAKQLHPVDQYEAFARLRDEADKTNEEIAHQYGLTEKEVRQALALGRLSPSIRDLWRRGEIKAEVAQAFTLALDHKTQDKLYKKLSKDDDLDRQSIRAELGVKGNDDIGALANFVGIVAYQDRGGKVTEDLFKGAHIVSDDVLLKAMVDERLQAECKVLVEQGWAWAAVQSDMPSSWSSWPTTRVDVSKFFNADEAALAKQLEKEEKDIEEADHYDFDAEQVVTDKIAALEASVTPRAFTDKQRSKLGCVVDVGDEGEFTVVYGISRPAAVSKAQAAAMEPAAGAAPEIKKPATAGSKAAEPDLSQALIERLSRQLTVAAQTALIQEQDLAISVLLANFASSGHCDGIRASVSGLGFAKLDLLGGKKFADNVELALALKPADRLALLVLVAGGALDFQRFSSNDDILLKGNPGLICNMIKPAAMNAALRGAFDAKDYFTSVPKALCIAAIKDALGTDVARQQEKKKGPEIAAFAIANVAGTGWLPDQLRAKGYDGPPKAKGLAIAGNAKPAKKVKVGALVKRAASAKKPVKKTSPKKAAAKKKR